MAHSTPSQLQTQMPGDPANRPVYNTDQLQTYFKRIDLPEKYLQSPILSDPSLAGTLEHGLPLVQAMTRYHTCNVPFENLELHYSAHKMISLNMDDLYVKFADRGLQYGRGGRCMENNSFFGTVLRSLGFEVRNCAGRVSRMMNPNQETREKQGQTYDGWNHMLNLVRFDMQWYIVDVGMGAMGLNMPIPLEDGFETVSIAPRKVRLQYRSIAEHSAIKEEDAQKLWCYDVCYSPASPDTSSAEDKWIPTYCFTELEFLPQDYEMMSWFTSTSPRSFFTQFPLCTKMIMDEESEKIVGDITMLGKAIRTTIGGKRELAKECESEAERVQALKEMFGVELTEEEREGIPQGMKL